MLCRCDIEEKGLFLLCISKYSTERQSSKNFCTSSRANLIGVSRTTVYAIKKRMDDFDVQAVVKRLSWIVTTCGMPFEAVPGRPCSNMQEDLGLERRLCDKPSPSLKPSSVSLWKDYCPRLLFSPSALNVARGLLMTTSLLWLEGWLSSQMRRLRLSILWETEVTTAIGLLEKRPGVLALYQNRNIQHPPCRSVLLHRMAQWCLWSSSRLDIDWLQGTTRPS